MSTASITGTRVVVVEANWEVRRLFASMLVGPGATACVEARSPLAAAEVCRHPLDLVILDLAGGQTDAMHFLHHLRQGQFGEPAPPVLGIVPASQGAIRRLAREAGISGLLDKPLSAMELIAKARTAMAASGAGATRRLRPAD